jgi:uroporphyrinogen III methyltransferase/synthase
VRVLVEHSAWPAAWPGRTRGAAVGPATAARLREAGVAVDRVGAGGGQDLARALVASGAVGPGTRVLWPRAEAGRPEPGRTLARAGAVLVDPVAYRTLAAHPALEADLEGFRAALESGRLAAVTFASPSAAEGLAEHLPTRDLRPLRGHTLVASIGATTSASLAERGAPADVEAERPRAEALARAVMGRLRVPQGAHT